MCDTISIMKKDTKKNPRLFWTNFLGKTGYCFLMLQWLCIVIVYFSFIYDVLIQPIMPQPREVAPQPTPPVSDEAFAWSPLSTALAVLLVALVVGVTIYALVQFPRMVSRAGERTVHAVARQAAPLAVRVAHEPVTKKNVLKMSPYLVFWLKAALVLLPILLGWLAQFSEYVSLDGVLVFFGCLLLSAPTILFFGFQYGAARLLRIPMEKLV